MAQDILTIFVYLLGLTITVTIFNLAIAIVQLIEDMPSIRKKIWMRKRRGLTKIQNQG